MKSAGIGDMVLATAIVRDLVAARPDARVILFAGSDNADAARLLAPEAEVIEVPMSRPWLAVRRLRAARLDVLLDLGQWTRVEALCSAMSGAGYTVGFATAGQRRAFCYDEVVPHANDVHELENFRRIVARLGVDSHSLPALAQSLVRGSSPAPEPFVVFHLWPGGFRSELKEWPAACWRELAVRLAREGYAIVLTGSSADAARTDAFVRSCRSVQTSMLSLAGRSSLAQVAAAFLHCSCVVSVNTGIMHLAAAAGVPTVALNGPTNDVRWGPIGPRTLSVNSPLEGCGYLNLGFEYEAGRTDCMDAITPERVADAVLRLVGR